MIERTYIFVFCKDYSEFLQYKKEFPNEKCEFIVDENTMRGRPPSKVVKYGKYEERWDYQAIEEACLIMEEVWEEIEKNMEDTDDTLDYGFG